MSRLTNEELRETNAALQRQVEQAERQLKETLAQEEKQKKRYKRKARQIAILRADTKAMEKALSDLEMQLQISSTLGEIYELEYKLAKCKVLEANSGLPTSLKTFPRPARYGPRAVRRRQAFFNPDI